MKNKILYTQDFSAQNAKDPSFSFVEKLGRALHRYGLPSHRLEEALVAVAERLDLHGEFFATPTAIFASLERDGAERTILIRVEPGELDLEKLSRLDGLLQAVVGGDVSPLNASAAVDEIVASPARYRGWMVVAGFAVASAAAARFFGGGWREFVVCAVIGLVTGALAIVAGRFPGRFRVFEPLAAFFAGLIAAGAATFLAPVSVYVATCAGLIVLIPGLSLTIAINELATRNLAAGTVRLNYALLIFLQIGFGVAVGLRVAALVFGAPAPVEPAGLPGWTLLAALAITAVGLTILFKARPRDVGWVALAGAVAFTGARAVANAAGPELGAFAGALLVGLVSNAFARLRQRPAVLLLVPGIMLLVPGSIGFQSVSSLIAADVVGGMRLAFTVGLMGIALVTGLLVASALVPPRRSL
jgi:uncharacterized membrane protein YjjP (DUF1212 family)